MKICLSNNKTAGLTLIEVLIAMSIAVALLGLGLFVSLDAYRGYIFRSERTVLISVLEKARSRAVNNMYDTAWGVCYDNSNKQYVIFRGSFVSGAPTNDTVPANSDTVIGPSIHCPSSLVFSQLTGNTSGGVITLTQSYASSTISVNEEGTINW